jgi:hypothetical protein
LLIPKEMSSNKTRSPYALEIFSTDK